MKIQYEEWNPSEDSLQMVRRANSVIAKYQRAKITLTIRQLYYQFVKSNWIKNTERNYQRLISVMGRARMAGLTDWNAIEDRTRNLERLPTWDSPADGIDAIAWQYRNDLWATQPDRVEVWIEKEALASVFETVCNELRVDFMCCRGYMSLSEIWTAGRRLRDRRISEGQRNIILHFGDHDPSGIDMTRDIEQRLSIFSEGPVKLIRCALNMDQIEEFQPPPNPCKVTDSRYASYQQLYGDESWELDALDPEQLRGLVAQHVEEYRDEELWRDAVDSEIEDRSVLKAISKNFDDVKTDLSGRVSFSEYRDDYRDEEDEEE